ncbi:MAG TPA: metalloregulator ArsR/SmtB family transcription factor [Phycisphaerales bacterium]|nr:metalloregulator ArsR/SmtB family transcription factor [Phycisphaerales bacterium]
MVEVLLPSSAPDRLDAIFGALADPTRRALVLALSEGERSIKELGSPFRVSFQAISKHVQVLERAGLVRRRVVGRTHLCRLEASALASADLWLKNYERLWNQRFDALEAMLKAEAEAERRAGGDSAAGGSGPRV